MLAWLLNGMGGVSEMITQQQYDELKAERDALAASIAALHRLHSDLTNADMVLDDGEHSGYLITNEQIDEMEHLLNEPQQCLAEIRAESVLKFAEDIGVFSREYDDQGYVEVAKWRVKEYAEEVRQGGAE